MFNRINRYKKRFRLFKILVLVLAILICHTSLGFSNPDAGKYNVVFIVADDLNDYVSVLRNHPQVKTPNLDRFAESAINFTNAQATAGWCKPSRAGFLTGTHLYHSRFRPLGSLRDHMTLQHNIPIQEYFRNRGYQSLSLGKTEHDSVYTGWSNVVQKYTYGPYWKDNSGSSLTFHPNPTDAPTADFMRNGELANGGLYNLAVSSNPFQDPFNPQQGDRLMDQFMTFGSFEATSGYEGLWTNGWAIEVTKDLDGYPEGYMTADRINAYLARRLMEGNEEEVVRLLKLDKFPADNAYGVPFRSEEEWNNRLRERFFMNIGFVRPHTPMHVEAASFSAITDDPRSVELLLDQEDILNNFVFDQNWRDRTDNSDRSYKRLHALYEDYLGDMERALKDLTHAYLANIHAFDKSVGIVLDAIQNNGYEDNTIVIITSDHGWHNGEWNGIGKNTEYEETCRVPFMIRVPEVSGGQNCDMPVSLADIYPTLIDLCEIEGDATVRNENGVKVSGHSIVPLILDPSGDTWTGPEVAVTSINPLNRGTDAYLRLENLRRLGYSVRSKTHRYVRYRYEGGQFGDELLFEMKDGQLDQKNDVSDQYPEIVAEMSAALDKLIERGSYVDAGDDQDISISQSESISVSLNGLVKSTDDIELRWEQVSGPYVNISNNTLADTEVIIDQEGDYVFKLTATNRPFDEVGEDNIEHVLLEPVEDRVVSDEITISVEMEEQEGNQIVGESGIVTNEQLYRNQWHTVTFQNSYNNPVVVMGPASILGGQPVFARVRNISSTGFQYKLEEWDYLDGAHYASSVSWLVIEEGDHILTDSTRIIAGKTAVTSDRFQRVEIPRMGFHVVLTQVESVNNPKPVSTRQRNHSNGHFSIRLINEEALNQESHGEETVSWIATATGTGDLLEVSKVRRVNDQMAYKDFNKNWETSPAVLANIQGTADLDPAALRLDRGVSNGFGIFVQEEQSADAETIHSPEGVGYIAIENGQILEAIQSTQN